MGNDLISAAGLIHIIEESRQSALKKVNRQESVENIIKECLRVLMG